jgi:hypothetical protein
MPLIAHHCGNGANLGLGAFIDVRPGAVDHTWTMTRTGDSKNRLEIVMMDYFAAFQAV